VYAIYLADRDEASLRFQEGGIRTFAYYAVPLHLRPAFAKLGYQYGDFPVAEKVTEELICLPAHPHLTDEQVERVIGVLERIT
jgi:dTDP-4-amino-4,6-dideoxygalactose transaminase